MLNSKQDIVTGLSNILPTEYELTCDSNTPIPCITYLEDQNHIYIAADNLEYTTIGYQIKIWAYTVEEITEYAVSVDNFMRTLGYKRIASNELTIGTLIQKVLSYEAIGIEKI